MSKSKIDLSLFTLKKVKAKAIEGNNKISQFKPDTSNLNAFLKINRNKVFSLN